MNAFVSVTESLAKIHAKEISYPELLSLYQTQIERTNESIQGFLDIFDTPVSTTETPLLPIAIKDNICLKDHPTTCASRILEHFIPPYQATVVQKLLDANLSILGKTNMDEFAMGSSNENSAFKITSNPWNTNHVPGGSSGGSAAVVAAGQAPWSLGSDTGGSIRQPASFCGIVGLKPTYGLVSRYGLVAYASSLDQIGPMTRTVEDNALLLTLIAGHDPKDSTSLNQDSPDFKAQLGQPIQGMKIGLPRQMFAQGISDEVKSALDAAIKVYESLGAHIEEVDLPHLNHALATYYLIATSEASSNLARYDGVSYGHRSQHASHLQEMITMSRTEGFGKEVKLRILLGTFALSEGYYDAYYKKAQQVRHLIIKGFKSAFEQFDALLSPTVPMTAFQKGEKTQDPLSMYLTDVLTVPANLAGLPALSVPCGFDSQGLPIGLQLMGKPLSEATLYQIAHAYEQATDWHKQHPEL